MIVFRICAKHHTTAYLDIFTVDKNNQLQPVESFGSALYGKKKKKEFSSRIYMSNKNPISKPFFFINKQLLFKKYNI